MVMRFADSKSVITFLILVYAGMQAISAKAASCTTQAQMAPAQRDQLHCRETDFRPVASA